MRLFWHILWKDLRAERGTVLLLTALFAGQSALGFYVATAAGLDGQDLDNFRVGNNLLVGLQFFVSYLLVVRLVQADEITGTRMFWLTRPIATRRMFTVKVAEVLLMAAVPIGLLLPWWLWNGFTPEDMVWASIELLGWQLLVMAPALLVASLTDDFGRALLWGLLLMVALVFGAFWMRDGFILGAQMVNKLAGAYTPLTYGVLFTRLWIGGSVLIFASILIAAHQFLTRHWLRSLALAVSVYAVAVVGVRMCNVSYAPIFAELSEIPIMDRSVQGEPAVAGIELTAGRTELQVASRRLGTLAAETMVLQLFELRGLPEDLAIARADLRRTLRWPSEENVTAKTVGLFGDSRLATQKALGLGPRAVDAETERYLKARYEEGSVNMEIANLSGYGVWRPRSDGRVLVSRNFLADELIDRIRVGTPAMKVRVNLDVARPVAVLEVPLRPGAYGTIPSGACRVGEWISRGPTASVQFLSSVPAVQGNGLWMARSMDSGRRDNLPGDFVVVNRTDNTIGWTNRSGNMSRSGRIVLGGVVLKWSMLTAHPERVVRDGKWVPSDPQWIEHSTLVLMRLGLPRRITKELELGKFELRAADPSKDRTPSPSL